MAELSKGPMPDQVTAMARNGDVPTQPDSTSNACTETPRSSEECYRLLVDGVKDYAIFMLDPIGHVVTWNTGAEHIKGYRAAEAIGKHFSLFYPAEDVAGGKPERELEIAAAEGRLEHDGWRVRKDGSRFWANVVITALRNDAGVLMGFAEVIRDMTERRAGEDALREAEERMRSVVNHVIDGIITIDERGMVESFNPAAEKIFGYPAVEVVGRNVKMLMPEPYHGGHDGYLTNYVRTHQPKIIGIGREVEGLRSDGSTFPMELAVSEFHLAGAAALPASSAISRNVSGWSGSFTSASRNSPRPAIARMSSSRCSPMSFETRSPPSPPPCNSRRCPAFRTKSTGAWKSSTGRSSTSPG